VIITNNHQLTLARDSNTNALQPRHTPDNSVKATSKKALSAALTELSICATGNQESFSPLSMDQSIRPTGHFTPMIIG